MRGFLVFIALTTCRCDAFTHEYDEIMALVPDAIKVFLYGMSLEDHSVLKQVHGQGHGDDTDSYLESVKELSTDLHDKATVLRDDVQAKEEALGDEAKDFMNHVIITLNAIIGSSEETAEKRSQMRELAQGFLDLDEEVRTDIENQYPEIANSHDNIEAFASGTDEDANDDQTGEEEQHEEQHEEEANEEQTEEE